MEHLQKVNYYIILGLFKEGLLNGIGTTIGLDLKSENILNKQQKNLEQPNKDINLSNNIKNSNSRLTLPTNEVNSPKSSQNSSINKYLYSFTGEFIVGQKYGYGREETSEYSYIGYYKNDHKHGNGKLRFKRTKDVYEGLFELDKFNGEGCYIWANGCSFNGNFVQGKMHGTGTYKWSDGTVYTGEYINNVKHGYGKVEKIDGNVIEGSFVNGKILEFRHSKTPIQIKEKISNNFLNINYTYNDNQKKSSKSNKNVTLNNNIYNKELSTKTTNHSSNSFNY